MTKPKRTDLWVITAHNEGSLLETAFASLAANTQIGVHVEIALDAADSATQTTAAALGCARKFMFRDVGRVRNFYLDSEYESGQILGFLDGDDFLSANWPAVAADSLRSSSGPAICFPRFRALFWDRYFPVLVFRQPRPSHPKLIGWLQQHTNMWASAFAARNVSGLPRFRDSSKGIVYEDWWFINDCLASGVTLLVVEGCLYYRQGPGRRRSMNARERFEEVASPRGNTHRAFSRVVGFIVLLINFAPLKSIIETFRLASGRTITFEVP